MRSADPPPLPLPPAIAIAISDVAVAVAVAAGPVPPRLGSRSEISFARPDREREDDTQYKESVRGLRYVVTKRRKRS